MWNFTWIWKYVLVTPLAPNKSKMKPTRAKMYSKTECQFTWKLQLLEKRYWKVIVSNGHQKRLPHHYHHWKSYDKIYVKLHVGNTQRMIKPDAKHNDLGNPFGSRLGAPNLSAGDPRWDLFGILAGFQVPCWWHLGTTLINCDLIPIDLCSHLPSLSKASHGHTSTRIHK